MMAKATPVGGSRPLAYRLLFGCGFALETYRPTTFRILPQL